jgi:hypothetical protein
MTKEEALKIWESPESTADDLRAMLYQTSMVDIWDDDTLPMQCADDPAAVRSLAAPPWSSFELIQKLRELNACREGLAWVRNNVVTSFDEVWATCPRASWMVWLAEKAGSPFMIRKIKKEIVGRSVTWPANSEQPLWWTAYLLEGGDLALWLRTYVRPKWRVS